MKNTAYGITRLKMTPHPEGGYFREEYRATKTILIEGQTGERSVMTRSYYLLEKEDFPAFNRLKSHESCFFHKGSPDVNCKHSVQV